MIGLNSSSAQYSDIHVCHSTLSWHTAEASEQQPSEKVAKRVIIICTTLDGTTAMVDYLYTKLLNFITLRCKAVDKISYVYDIPPFIRLIK